MFHEEEAKLQDKSKGNAKYNPLSLTDKFAGYELGQKEKENKAQVS